MKIRHCSETAMWVAQSEDFPVASQGRTPEEAVKTLRSAVYLYLRGHDEQKTDPPTKEQA